AAQRTVRGEVGRQAQRADADQERRQHALSGDADRLTRRTRLTLPLRGGWHTNGVVSSASKKKAPLARGFRFVWGVTSSENRFTLFRITPLFDAELFDQ